MTLPKTPPKTYKILPEIAEVILGYVKIDNDYGRNMRNFALVETSWCKPATDLLYTHLYFETYDELTNYLRKIHLPEYVRYASTAQSICLSRLTGPDNTEKVFCHLVESCPNIVSFKISRCPPPWVTESVLLYMSTHWPRLAQLSLHSRNHIYGRKFIKVFKHWPDLTHLDLTDVWAIDENKYHEIIRLLPNLRSIRLSRQVNELSDPMFRDRMSNGLLRAISETSQFLKVIELNNCTRLSNFPLRNCFYSLANTVECLVITGCKQISGITLAEVIAACDSLRFVDISRSCFNNKALRHLSGTSSDGRPEVTPRIGQQIEQFAMSDCSDISLADFRRFANVLGSHVRDGHVKKCTVYVRGVTHGRGIYGETRRLDKDSMKELERFNPGLIINPGCTSFVIDEIIESIVVGPMA